MAAEVGCGTASLVTATLDVEDPINVGFVDRTLDALGDPVVAVPIELPVDEAEVAAPSEALDPTGVTVAVTVDGTVRMSGLQCQRREEPLNDARGLV